MKKLKTLFDIEKKKLKKYEAIANDVISMQDEISLLTDEELSSKTNEFIERLENGESINDIMVEAFAVVCEADFRVLKMRPFKVQIIGACALADGNIAEMKTGEGKTLTATMPVYLLSLKNKGVHVVTVNDYLVERDATEMGQVYEFLGRTYGINKRELDTTEKRASYSADITYTTNSELGFDYLRDNMVMDKEGRVQRGLENVIIDEIDSILIDEARTPLIISGQEKKTQEYYTQVDALVKNFKVEEHYEIEVKEKSSHLTNKGIDVVESAFGIKNLFNIENSQLMHAINQALRANYNMHKDVDYVVRNGAVVIVDQFTGRIMEGRAYSDGLHQAIEAKEGVTTQKQTKTMATITYQNLFRLYNISAGMTGTAKTEEEEFQKTYDMDVIRIPTNVDVIRNDLEDVIFVTKEAKNKFMLQVIKERYEQGQPLLIGTVAIESSEEIAEMLTKENIPFQLLNAKNHASEAEIIKLAGKKSTVTIATNMAGRGTDIKLSEEVCNLGTFHSKVFDKEFSAAGLMIIGTERHESRRIDNQLRGRAGRQGDPGTSIFFISFEDDLLKRYAGDKAKRLLGKLAADMPIENKILTKRIESAQKEVESVNYDTRKNLLKYDDVLREQRENMYLQRDYIIDCDDLIKEIRIIMERYISHEVDYYLELDDIQGLKDAVSRNISNKSIDHENKEYKENIIALANEELDNKIKEHGEELINEFIKTIMIKVLDEEWIDHIDQMQNLRESIGLRGYGQIDPLLEYQKEGRDMFEAVMDSVEKNIIKILLKGKIKTDAEREAMMSKLKTAHDNAVGKKQETVIKNTDDVIKKQGRNELCACGSGIKFKNCHGK